MPQTGPRHVSIDERDPYDRTYDRTHDEDPPQPPSRQHPTSQCRQQLARRQRPARDCPHPHRGRRWRRPDQQPAHQRARRTHRLPHPGIARPLRPAAPYARVRHPPVGSPPRPPRHPSPAPQPPHAAPAALGPRDLPRRRRCRPHPLPLHRAGHARRRLDRLRRPARGAAARAREDGDWHTFWEGELLARGYRQEIELTETDSDYHLDEDGEGDGEGDGDGESRRQESKPGCGKKK
ncbi:hypothetical protein B0H67DRAFT_265279 [Lasiosphaeris hirsuta]|uniref:Uncharacterized protein n=1 Tax=Lasiosphaeris hirsuta TaxID=260670 RepID=A0AA40A7Q1_9PEZI|nr:hypothetical protein B0H67DRAFT_265279 [Lasiosphaeris hirsuta]